MPSGRGRPPKPTEVHRRNGNPSRKFLPEPVAVLPALEGVPPVPAELEATGTRFWTDAWTLGRVWLTAQDYSLMLQAAKLFDEIDRFQAEVDEFGILVEEPILYRGDDTGFYDLKANPAIAAKRACEVQLGRDLSDLGITPTARARLGLVQVKAQTKLQELFS